MVTPLWVYFFKATFWLILMGIAPKKRGKKTKLCWKWFIYPRKMHQILSLSLPDEPKTPGPIELEQTVQGKVLISWAPSPDQELDDRIYYVVYQHDSNTRVWKIVADRLFTNTYTANNILPGLEYHFRVYAKNDMGLSDPSQSPTWGANSYRGAFSISAWLRLIITAYEHSFSAGKFVHDANAWMIRGGLPSCVLMSLFSKLCTKRTIQNRLIVLKLRGIFVKYCFRVEKCTICFNYLCKWFVFRDSFLIYCQVCWETHYTIFKVIYLNIVNQHFNFMLGLANSSNINPINALFKLLDVSLCRSIYLRPSKVFKHFQILWTVWQLHVNFNTFPSFWFLLPSSKNFKRNNFRWTLLWEASLHPGPSESPHSP